MPSGVAQQDVIVRRPVDLPGPDVGIDQGAPIQHPLVIAPQDHATALDLKAVRGHGVVRARQLQRRLARCEEGFPDMVTRKRVALEQQDAQPGARQQRRRRRSGGAAADHQHVHLFDHQNTVTMAPSPPHCKRRTGPAIVISGHELLAEVDRRRLPAAGWQVL